MGSGTQGNSLWLLDEHIQPSGSVKLSAPMLSQRLNFVLTPITRGTGQGLWHGRTPCRDPIPAGQSVWSLLFHQLLSWTALGMHKNHRNAPRFHLIQVKTPHVFIPSWLISRGRALWMKSCVLYNTPVGTQGLQIQYKYEYVAAADRRLAQCGFFLGFSTGLSSAAQRKTN